MKRPREFKGAGGNTPTCNRDRQNNDKQNKRLASAHKIQDIK